jgi:hypothetical protein
MTLLDYEREDLRTKHQAATDCERTTTQLRFQTLSLFLAAVGLIVGLGQQSRSVGALLLLIGAGLWVLDLRNRALLQAYRSVGMKVEERMNELNGGSGGVFVENPPGKLTATRIGFFTWQGHLRGRLAGLVSYQVGIDLIVFGVMGYGVRLLVHRRGWVQLDALVPVLVVLAAVIFTRWIPGESGRSPLPAAEPGTPD